MIQRQTYLPFGRPNFGQEEIDEVVVNSPAYDVKRQMIRKCFVARKAPHEYDS